MKKKKSLFKRLGEIIKGLEEKYPDHYEVHETESPCKDCGRPTKEQSGKCERCEIGDRYA